MSGEGVNMKVRVYDLNGTKAVKLPPDIVKLLGWSTERELDLHLVKPTDNKEWRVELKRW